MIGIATYLAILLASLALFWFVPQTDLFVSGLFYSPEHGFALATWPPLVALEGVVRWITWAEIVGILAASLWLRLRGRPLWRLDRNVLIFLLAALAIGPGIIANTVLKDHWGRARPLQISAFGGTKTFTGAPLPADQCERNCAFVSGHAALAFSLVGFTFLMPAGRQRRIALGAVLGLGALIGLARIASGHHFLSDVVDAGLITVATTWLLHRWIVVHDGVTPLVAFVERLGETPGGRRWRWAAAIVLGEAAAMIWIDRPLADFMHAAAGPVQPFFDAVQRFGLGYPYLVLSALAFAALRWGGRIERLRGWDSALRGHAYIPAFIFTAVAASGLVADLLKVTIGRTRPKLLFATGAYDFTWFGLKPDHWSFPSGHAATVTALMTALWCLWPRPLWLYGAAAALVAASRVVTGQHYLSDVVAGAAIAVVVTRAVAAYLLRDRGGATARDAAQRYRPV